MKKIMYVLTIFVSIFMLGANVKAAVIDSNEFLTLEESSGNYTITILKDVNSTDFYTFFKSHFGTMLDGDITVKGNDNTITNTSTTNTMIPLGGGDFTKGTAATYNAETETWSTDNAGWFGYNHNLSFENINFVGTGGGTGAMLFYIVLPSANISFDKCEFQGYQKAALWIANLNSLSVNECSFDGNSVSASAEAPTLFGQSSESISLCLGDEFIVGSSSYSTHKVQNISITNNTFENVETETPNGTGAIKLKIKNITVVSGVEIIKIKNNTFTNNGVDFIIGEKNPETAKPATRPTTSEESGDIDVRFFNNTSTNTGGLKVQTVYNLSTATEAERTNYFATDATASVLFNAVKNIKLYNNEQSNDFIMDNETALTDALDYIKNFVSEEVEGLVINNENYSIYIDKDDIKENREGTINDLSLIITNTLPEKISTLAEKGSILVSSIVSGTLPAEKITVKTKIAEFAGMDVKINYFNETTNKLELVSTVRADAEGNFEFDLTHYSQYVLTAEKVAAEPNPQTGDGIMSEILLGSIAVIGLIGTGLYLRKKGFN